MKESQDSKSKDLRELKGWIIFIVYLNSMVVAVVAVIIMYRAENRCPIESIDGPNFEEFTTLLGHDNEAILTF